jgi:nitrogen-specific signal transduction histidine kinase
MRVFRSIRWRFQLWLAFLLIAILSGFGVSAYQLHRQNRLELIDEDLPHVFERFYRADKARGSAEGRSGLGLSICRAIVQARCGTMSVASKPGADTAFTVRLPRFPQSRINWETPG